MRRNTRSETIHHNLDFIICWIEHLAMYPLSPEELEDLVRTIREGFKNIARTLASFFDDLATFFKSFDET